MPSRLDALARRAGFLGTAFLLAAASGAAPSQSGPETLAVAGRANANPSIAARGSFVAIAWSAATADAMDVYAALSADGGHTFSAPARVNATAGDARVGSEQPPRVALVPHAGSGKRAPDIVVIWTSKGVAGTRLLTARSTDGGRTFGDSRSVPGSEGHGSRGWESVAVGADGRVAVIWLDHRETMASGSAMKMGDGRADPTERAQLSQLYFASLGGAGAKSLTRGVCYCCKTSLVADGKDIYAVWRHVYADSHRDIAFTMSRDGGRTFASPRRVSSDNWRIDGCPENGPAVAVDRGHRVHVVWPTPPDGKSGTPLGLFYSTSNNGGAFAPREALPTHGSAAHAQIVIDREGRPVVAWDEVVNGHRRLAMTRIRSGPGGVRLFDVRLFELIGGVDATQDNGWPVLATAQSGVVAAWVQGVATTSVLRVATLR